MCTYIIERTPLEGSAKGAQGWFTVDQANVCFDHPVHVPLDHALLIDFVDKSRGPDARVAVELSAESAEALILAIQNALESAKIAHAA